MSRYSVQLATLFNRVNSNLMVGCGGQLAGKLRRHMLHYRTDRLVARQPASNPAA